MNFLILAHAGGLDEMGIIVIPAVVGFGTWILTRRRHEAGTKPNHPVAHVTSPPRSGNGAPVAQPGWKPASARSTAWTNPGSSNAHQ
jgi:hypothetical protein